MEAIFDEIVARHRASGHVHLNDISEIIGLRAVTYDEVEQLVTRLEEAGYRVGEPLDATDVQVMRAVLDHARRLREKLGRRPTVEEIAEASGQPAHAVRRSLEHGAAAAGARRPLDPAT